MLICTAVFTGILSGTYVYTRPLINSNENITRINARLYAMGVSVPTLSRSSEIEQMYVDLIEERNQGDMTVYIYRDHRDTFYGFPFSGPGLWGDIEGVIALNQGLDRMIGLAF